MQLTQVEGNAQIIVEIRRIPIFHSAVAAWQFLALQTSWLRRVYARKWSVRSSWKERYKLWGNNSKRDDGGIIEVDLEQPTATVVFLANWPKVGNLSQRRQFNCLPGSCRKSSLLFRSSLLLSLFEIPLFLVNCCVFCHGSLAVTGDQFLAGLRSCQMKCVLAGTNATALWFLEFVVHDLK